MIETAEKKGDLSIYTIAKIKKDFDFDDISETDDIMKITIDGGNYEEN